MNIDNLKAKIAKARTDEVFRELSTFLEGKETELVNKFKLIEFQWSDLKKTEIMLSVGDISLKKNSINFALLNLLDEFKAVFGDEVELNVIENIPGEAPGTSMEQENKTEEEPVSGKIRILFLSANPADTSQLQLDKEFVEIQKLIQNSPEKDKFELNIDTKITPDKLHDAIQKYRPHIFHFSGHGFGTGELKNNEGDRSSGNPPALSGLIIEDERGNRKILAGTALDGLFELLAEEADVQAVILNACYSAEQAKIIKKHVKSVIGMTDAIGDKSAITFASGFYRAISNGKDIERAFKYGKNLMALQGTNEEHKVILV